MFNYGDEWYWGADRFHHLERRLIDYGACKREDGALICPRPDIDAGPLKDDGSLTFEIFTSIRSPYSSIAFDAALTLAADTGVEARIGPNRSSV